MACFPLFLSFFDSITFINNPKNQNLWGSF